MICRQGVAHLAVPPGRLIVAAFDRALRRIWGLNRFEIQVTFLPFRLVGKLGMERGSRPCKFVLVVIRVDVLADIRTQETLVNPLSAVNETYAPRRVDAALHVQLMAHAAIDVIDVGIPLRQQVIRVFAFGGSKSPCVVARLAF